MSLPGISSDVNLGSNDYGSNYFSSSSPDAFVTSLPSLSARLMLTLTTTSIASAQMTPTFSGGTGGGLDSSADQFGDDRSMSQVFTELPNIMDAFPTTTMQSDSCHDTFVESLVNLTMYNFPGKLRYRRICGCKGFFKPLGVRFIDCFAVLL